MTEVLIQRPIVDVSHFQRPQNCNWPLAKEAGIRGLIIKASQGASGHDPAFLAHLRAGQEAQLLLGAYSFLTDAPAEEQAEEFLNLLDAALEGNLDGFLVALDLEGNPRGGSETVSGAAAVASFIEKELGRWPVLYMGAFGPDGKGSGLPNETLSKCDLWEPAYSDHPRLPKGFIDPAELPPKAGGQRVLWQDTDGQAHRGQAVPGLGRVDQSRCPKFRTLEELTEWWGK